jgi:release factor glutamine methyltransferase
VYVPNCEVVATERSGTAAEFARKNAAAHDVQGRVTVVQGELFEPLRRMGFGGKLDLVVSNPPYIAEAEFESLPASVRDYEPREALVAGEEGTEYHRRIAREAPEFLVPGGLLVLEVGLGQAARVAQIISGTGAFSKPWTIKDYGGIERVVLARRA